MHDTDASGGWAARLEDRLARLAPQSDRDWLLLLAGVGLLIYLPWLGAYPLWDPWEPHYTQVAWEMQEQNTWFNPRYRGLDNWWSKPILLLWMIRASLALFWEPINHFADNEFIARLPFALAAIGGGLLQYHWGARLFGRRVGGLAALILITAPQYLLIGRQVMIDVPFVATYAASMGYLAVGLFCRRTVPESLPQPLQWLHTNASVLATAVLTAAMMLAAGILAPLPGLLVVGLPLALKGKRRAWGWGAILAALVLLLGYLPLTAHQGFSWQGVLAWYPEDAIAAGVAAVLPVIPLAVDVGARWVWRRLSRHEGVARFGTRIAETELAAARWWWVSYPFVLFWALQALSVLAKGFVPPALAVIVLAGYWTATFRWRDYQDSIADVDWRRYGTRAAVASLAILLAGGLLIWGIGQPILHGAWARAAGFGESLWFILGAVLWRGWIAIGLVRVLRDGGFRRHLGTRFGVIACVDIVLRVATGLVGTSGSTLILWSTVQLGLALVGIHLCSRRVDPNTGLTTTDHRLALAGGAGLVLGLTGAMLAQLTLNPPRPANPLELDLYRGIVASLAGVLVFLGVLRRLPPAAHAWRLLLRMRAGWGLVLFFLIAAPWYAYMSFEHGWPYWNEFIFYHHLGRAAGTIDKPNNTFDYYVLQVGVALFPWSGFLLASVWRFLARCNPLAEVRRRRNFFILLSAALPYLFFTLSGTKFAHYIFPVIPFVGVIIAATLVWLGRDGADEPDLAEEEPALGPPAPEAKPPEAPNTNGRGELVVFIALALIGFGILAHDLVIDFRLYLRLFIYYYNRATPPAYHPFIILQILYLPIGIAIGVGLFMRWLARAQLLAIGSGAVVLACYLAWVTLPAMGATYSFKPLYEAYEEIAGPREEIGQFNDWQQPVRSVIFLFQNRCKHLRNSQKTKAFLQRPGRKFILVDQNQLPALRRIAREVDKRLYVVFDDHPYGRLVSDVPNSEDSRRIAEFVRDEPPAGMKPIGADFGPLEMLGYQLSKESVRPGESVTVSFFYRAKELMDRDWQIFVHGDGPRGGSHRIHRDHFPLDGLYPTTEWQEGEVVEDRFEVDLPADYPFDWLVLWTGWYIGATRLELKNHVPSDGDNRVRGPRIVVEHD